MSKRIGKVPHGSSPSNAGYETGRMHAIDQCGQHGIDHVYCLGTPSPAMSEFPCALLGFGNFVSFYEIPACVLVSLVAVGAGKEKGRVAPEVTKVWIWLRKMSTPIMEKSLNRSISVACITTILCGANFVTISLWPASMRMRTLGRWRFADALVTP
ncbi:hypothetical protein F4778DRAFT_629642 [Xylariomycetidae sp. FL2044]|nr:hypothetical protein F4778DRAFT_629642 [Xylariomycetidae sp. FL2044]